MGSLHEFLGIELPIVQAPMAGVQASELAIAVSNAGGLGALPCAMLSLDQMRAELSQIRDRTRKPFNVNFFCHTPPEPDAAREAAWRAALWKYYEEFGIDPDAIPPAPSRSPFSEQAADLLEEFKPPVVSFHFGLPSRGLMARVKALGCTILGCATNVDEALWLEAHGVDAVIAQGFEAGGHQGTFLSTFLSTSLSADVATPVGTFALLPQVVKAVKLPVIAAGGIADAGGVAAALSLGAAAAQIGTSYLLCPEATTSSVHRAALKSAQAAGPGVKRWSNSADLAAPGESVAREFLQSVDSRYTTITRIFSGRPARGIVNRLIRELGPMNDLAPAFPLAAAALAPLRSKAESRGDGGFSPLWCGQNATGCSELPASEVTHMLAGA